MTIDRVLLTVLCIFAHWSVSAHDEVAFFENISPIVAEKICEDDVFLNRTKLHQQQCKKITDLAEMRCLAIVSPIPFSDTVEGKPNEDELRETYAILYRFCMQSMTLMILEEMEIESKENKEDI